MKGRPRGWPFFARANMTDDLTALQTETETALAAARDLRAWDAIRVGVLGKNGRLTMLLKELGKASPEQRRERGAQLNRLKEALAAVIEARRIALGAAALDAQLAAEKLDVSLPPRRRESEREYHSARRDRGL